MANPKNEKEIMIDLSKYSINENIDYTYYDHMWSRDYNTTMVTTTPGYEIVNMSLPNSTNNIWTTISSPTIDYNSDSIVWDNTVKQYVEFDTHFPPIDVVKEMCEIYPGLKKAFDHFKDIYDLVKDDFESRKKLDE